MVVTPSPFEWFARQELASLRSQRRFVIGVVLSLLFHTALLLLLPARTLEDQAQAEATPGQPDGGALTVRLNPAKPQEPKTDATTPPPAVARANTPPPPRVLAVPRDKPAPFRVPIAPESTVPPMATAPPPLPNPPPTPPQPQQPPDNAPPTDMVAMIAAARARRAAQEAAVAGDNANARSREQQGNNGLAALNRNLQSVSRGTGDTGGVFQILEKGTRRAQFAFRGWANDTRGSWKEVIEVDAGQGGDVDRAIIRRMIELIRGYYKGDFKWESHRLGRVVTLSARLADNEGLEAFLMQEFFK
jgi:hypothetical protein